MTPEQYIINACVANDPSIMELKFGCKVKVNYHDIDFIFTVIGENYAGNIVCETAITISDITTIKKNKIIEILGRDIFIGDILGAMDYSFGILGTTGEIIEHDRDGYQVLGTWNLKKPLHEQTVEVKELVAKLLGIKE
jgi:hypothetical protein